MYRKTVLSVGMLILALSFAWADQQGAVPETPVQIETVLVKGGCFDMGDTFGDGHANEKPVHQICVPDFSIGKYEVTQGQWKALMGNNPSHFRDCGDTCPVERVSWYDVQEFMKRLGSHTGKLYRLPTEAEWEYAARSGGKEEKYAGTSSYGELGGYAWLDSNAEGRTHAVGKKRPNGLGLCDMSGNVSEWVSDWYGYYLRSSRDNLQGPSSGNRKVFRGGSWNSSPWGVRASNRYKAGKPAHKDGYLGFRVACSPAE